MSGAFADVFSGALRNAFDPFCGETDCSANMPT